MTRNDVLQLTSCYKTDDTICCHTFDIFIVRIICKIELVFKSL